MCNTKKDKPVHIKTVNPYDLNSLYESNPELYRRQTWVDWNDKPSPYDLSDRRKRHKK